MKIFAVSVNLKQDYFEGAIDKPMVQMMLVHYPPLIVEQRDKGFGIGAHTDYECFTLLLQDSCSGLEIKEPNGQWIPIPPVDGNFVINIGGMMARWTNGLFNAALHRVINNPEQDRFSVPFFFATNYDTKIKCIQTCYNENNHPKYNTVFAGDYLQGRLESIYGKLATQRE